MRTGWWVEGVDGDQLKPALPVAPAGADADTANLGRGQDDIWQKLKAVAEEGQAEAERLPGEDALAGGRGGMTA